MQKKRMSQRCGLRSVHHAMARAAAGAATMAWRAMPGTTAIAAAHAPSSAAAACGRRREALFTAGSRHGTNGRAAEHALFAEIHFKSEIDERKETSEKQGGREIERQVWRGRALGDDAGVDNLQTLAAVSGIGARFADAAFESGKGGLRGFALGVQMFAMGHAFAEELLFVRGFRIYCGELLAHFLEAGAGVRGFGARFGGLRRLLFALRRVDKVNFGVDGIALELGTELGGVVDIVLKVLRGLVDEGARPLGFDFGEVRSGLLNVRGDASDELAVAFGNEGLVEADGGFRDELRKLVGAARIRHGGVDFQNARVAHQGDFEHFALHGFDGHGAERIAQVQALDGGSEQTIAASELLIGLEGFEVDWTDGYGGTLVRAGGRIDDDARSGRILAGHEKAGDDGQGNGDGAGGQHEFPTLARVTNVTIEIESLAQGITELV